MLRQRHRFFRTVLIAPDIALVALAAFAAYVVRFIWLADRYPPAENITTFESHGIPWFVVTPCLIVAMMWCGLYKPRRDQRFVREAFDLARAVALGLGMTIIALELFRNALFDGRDPSRLQYFVYAALVTVALIVWRFTFRCLLRMLRAKGWNLRHVAIIGTGRLGQVVHQTLMRNSWAGIRPKFFIAHADETARERCDSLPVEGGLDQLEQILDEQLDRISGVFIALPARMGAALPDLLTRLERYPIDVRVVPDVNPKHMPINMAVSDLEGMPILSVRESPLNGWGAVSKRTLDIVGALFAIALFGLPMLVIILLVRFSGPGPIIFRQPRMSLNGRTFDIFKFRTMREADAEQQALRDRGKGTAAWTQKNDPRITRFGALLRRTSLDELPQLFNVLLGEMSLVGPRPERPELIEQFREDWRGYMLRQNVKSGITGWAQVNGLRGDTSLRKRLQYDLFYIRNWSIMFDIRILWMTIFKGFANPNAR